MHNFMSTYPSGGFTYPKSSKTSHNPVPRSTRILFEVLRTGPKHKKILANVMADVNDHSHRKSYNDSTIAWHTTNGRFLRTRIGKYSVFTLTPKGFAYAKERGIFS